MEYIYGKLNKQLEQIEYKGSTTKTATIYVDNKTHTLSVDVLGGSGSAGGDYLSYSVDQDLADFQLGHLYKNLKLNDYLDSKAILQNKANQSISGNLTIGGSLTADGLLSVSAKDGIKFNNYNDNDADALLRVDKKGLLNFNGETVFTGSNLTDNLFTYFNGCGLSTRFILPSDIYTKNYSYEDIKNNDQLTNKEYVDKAVRRDTNYAIVASYEDFAKVTAWKGRRVHIIECDTEDDELHFDNPESNPVGEEVNAINE